MDQHEAISELYPEIEKAAKRVAYEWSDVVDWEDLVQDVATKILEKRQAVNLLAFEPRGRASTLRKIAIRIASQERDDFEYFRGNFRYSVSEVQNLLRAGALIEVGQDTIEDQGRHTTAGEPGFSHTQAIFREPKVVGRVADIDVRVAFDQITDSQQAVLHAKYVTRDYDGNPGRVAESEEAITHAMNRNRRQQSADHDGPGSRVAVTNATAQILVKRQLEEG